jgi:hypothetical protein
MNGDNQLRQYAVRRSLEELCFDSLGYESDPCRPQHLWQFNMRDTLVNMAKALKTLREENQALREKQGEHDVKLRALTEQVAFLELRLEAPSTWNLTLSSTRSHLQPSTNHRPATPLSGLAKPAQKTKHSRPSIYIPGTP